MKMQEPPQEDTTDIPNLAQYYGARLLMCRCIYPAPLTKRQRPEDTLAMLLGWDEDTVEHASQEELRVSLDVLSKLAYKALMKDKELHKSTALIQKEFNLTDLESEILLLASLTRFDNTIMNLSGCFRLNTRHQLVTLLAEALAQPIAQIRNALCSESRLIQSGLLKLECNFRNTDLEDALSVNETLGQLFYEQRVPKADLYREFSRPAPAPRVNLTDYSHLKTEVAFMVDLLKGTSREQESGVNILLYGPPGTGKTQLARCLVSACGAYGAETLDENLDNNPIESDKRLRNYALGQRLLGSRSNTLFIFDEVEEILDSEDSGLANLFGNKVHAVSNDKAWKNRLLEENGVPTIWIANHIDRVDKALLRRFTFTLHVKAPPQAKRTEMIKNSFSDFSFSNETAKAIASSNDLTPADIERTLKAVRLAGTDEDNAEERIVMAMTGRPDGVQVQQHKQSGLACLPYNPNWIQTSPDMSDISSLLKTRGQGRLMFSGPPGTGKTAFATHLANELETTLLLKKASDLISPFIGETERKIKEAFEEASRDNALLFIDEADSFLQDREHAARSWEFSQVNELLTQIDKHNGYLILATNFADRLDSALSRRIDLKVEFKRLSNDLATEAIYAAAKAMGITKPQIRKALNKTQLPLTELALGDVVAAMRQAQLRSLNPKAEMLVDALHAELTARKDYNNQPMGFVH